MITIVFTWGGIYIIKGEYPIIKAPDYNLVPEKPPFDGDFIKSQCNFPMGILISNFLKIFHLLYYLWYEYIRLSKAT